MDSRARTAVPGIETWEWEEHGWDTYVRPVSNNLTYSVNALFQHYLLPIGKKV